jgi:hypothetical protein
MSLKVETRGAEILATKYRAFDGKATLTRIANDYMARMQIDLNHYPPVPPRSKYQRTGTLGRGWLHRVEGAQGIVRLENVTPYAPWVQGYQQAWMHVGRWETVEQVMARYHDRMIDSMRRVVREELVGAK